MESNRQSPFWKSGRNHRGRVGIRRHGNTAEYSAAAGRMGWGVVRGV
jgi:hypothetical protein